MNRDALTMLVLLVVGVAIFTCLVIGLILHLCNLFGMRQVFKEGVVMTENGIEYAGFLWLSKLYASYDDIKSVKLLPYHFAYFSFVSFRYFPCRWLCKRVFTNVVIIELNGAKDYKYILFTPANCDSFIEKMRRKGVN